MGEALLKLITIVAIDFFASHCAGGIGDQKGCYLIISDEAESTRIGRGCTIHMI